MWYNYNPMRFGEEKEVEIVKALAQKSAYKVGLDFNFDKVYPTPKKVRSAVLAIYNKVKNNVDKYDITQDALDVIAQSMADRRVWKTSEILPTAQEVENDLQARDIKQVTTSVRDKAWTLIEKKLERVSTNKKKLDALSFKDLGTIAGIAFDKTQVLKGEATEHIAVMGKIDGNLSAEDAIKLVLKGREHNVEIKNQ